MEIVIKSLETRQQRYNSLVFATGPAVADAAKLRRLSCSEDDFIYFLPVAATSLRAGFQVYLSKLWVVDVTKEVRYNLNDWKVVADLSDGYMFPGHIAVSALRPDIVIYSNTLKRVIIVELTCPCEENMESWHSTKLLKYSGLASVISCNGWYCDLFTIEVGARGVLLQICYNLS